MIGGTPLEQALFEAYDRGVIIAGTGSGSNMLTTAMIGGYQTGFTNDNSMNFGAAELLNSAEQHGLILGLQNAVLEQNFFQQGLVGRLINAISLPESPHLGVGVDAYTGVHILEGAHLERVFGLYTVAILDAGTYNSAHNVQYSGLDYTISLRNVIVNLMPPGDFVYDLEARSFTLFGQSRRAVNFPQRIQRSFGELALPDGAGALILAGDVSGAPSAASSLERLVELAGGNPERILIYADGYSTGSAAELAAQKTREILGGRPRYVFIDPAQPESTASVPPNSYDGVIFIAEDLSRLHIDLASGWLKDAWMSGKPLLAGGVAPAAIGAFYSQHPPTPIEGFDHETAAQKSFIKGNTSIMPGLSLLNLTVEPYVLSDNRWGRLFSLAYNHPEYISLGLTEGAVVEITRDGAAVNGNNAVFVLDLSQAELSTGENQAFAIANGLLDVFSPGESLAARDASTIESFTRAPTPFIPTSTSTPVPTATPTSTGTPVPPTPVPTRTPRPTATPLTVPPPSDPSTTHLIAISGITVVVVIIFGLWLNRRRVF